MQIKVFGNVTVCLGRGSVTAKHATCDFNNGVLTIREDKKYVPSVQATVVGGSVYIEGTPTAIYFGPPQSAPISNVDFPINGAQVDWISVEGAGCLNFSMPTDQIYNPVSVSVSGGGTVNLGNRMFRGITAWVKGASFLQDACTEMLSLSNDSGKTENIYVLRTPSNFVWMQGVHAMLGYKTIEEWHEAVYKKKQ